MKKVLFILASILIAVWAVLSLFGAGDEYAAEKVFYHAMKTNEKIMVNPEVVPPAMIASVESDLAKILKKYPKGNMAKAAHIALAEFYLSNKKYDRALSEVSLILSKYASDKLLSSRAQFLKGAVYEKQNRWEKAVLEYRALRDNYPDTPLGMEIPLYIGKRYMEKRQLSEAEAAYNEAARFYERLESQNRQKAAGYIASTLLMQAYMNLGKYEQAGRTVQNTINNYPGRQTLMQQLPHIELIYIRMLKRPQAAIDIYKDIENKIKDANLKRALRERIKKLETQKR